MADLAASIRKPVSKVIAVGDPPRPMELIERGAADVRGPRRRDRLAPAVPRVRRAGVSKGRAVAWLAQRAGIPMGQVMAVGDALQRHRDDRGRRATGRRWPRRRPRSARRRATSRAPVDEDGVGALIEALVLAPEAERPRRRAARGGGSAGRAADPRGDDPPAAATAACDDPGAPRRRRGARRGRRPAARRAGSSRSPPTRSTGSPRDLALPDAIERLFAAKRRPPEKAVAVLLADAAQAWSLGIVSPAASLPRRAVLARRPDARAAGPPRGAAAARARRRHADDRRPRAGPSGAARARRGPRPAADDLRQPLRRARRPRRARRSPRPSATRSRW